MAIPKKFTFYTVYINELNKLNPFQFKKVINALVNYANEETVPFNLSGKGQAVFNKIQTVLMAEKLEISKIEKKSDAGKKGAERRWRNSKK